MASLATAVRRAVKGAGLPASDLAAAELAVTLAKAIDTDPDQLGARGNQLLAVLEALHMTPRARAAGVNGGGHDSKRANPLDQLRERRAARERDAAAVDTTAP